jgi:GT2 family glycosyltransferase
MKVEDFTSDALFNLPFDLYTRNFIVAQIARAIRKEEKFRILDIGGRSGHLNQFLQDDDVFILDIRASEAGERNYILGDITCAPLKDGLFDLVVSLDLFEHISPEDRERALAEMIRVGKNFVILGAPFYSEEAAEAEVTVHEFFLKLTGSDHPWLSEHIKHGLPLKKDLEHFLEAKGYECLTIPNNNISTWLLMQLFIFYSYKYSIAPESVSRIYRFYNEHFMELGDTMSPAYRTIYVIGKRGTLPGLGSQFTSRMDPFTFHSLEALIFEVMSECPRQKDEILGTVVREKDTYIGGLETLIKNRDDYIHGLETSIRDKDDYTGYLEDHIQGLAVTLKNQDSLIVENHKKLKDMYYSLTWQSLIKYQRIIEILFPQTTRRRQIYDLTLVGIRSILHHLFGALPYALKRDLADTTGASKPPIVETKIGTPHSQLSLEKNLCGRFTFPSENFSEIKIFTATNGRRTSDLLLSLTNASGEVLRRATVKGERIQENGYTSFRFKPVKESKGETFAFTLISKKEPSAAVWYSESMGSPELTLMYQDAPLAGSIGFQAFTDREMIPEYDMWMLKNEPGTAKLLQYQQEIQHFDYQPTISIITPVFNPDIDWIEGAIESVRRQVYENWELCLADASTRDEVRACLKAYARKDPRIKVKFLRENNGISENSNEALALATGEYVGFLDHDDSLSPDALYHVVKHLQNHRDSGLIYSDEDKIDLDDKRRDPFFKPDWSPDMFLSCMYTCHFSVYPKKIIDEIGGFRREYDGSQDYDLALRVMDKTRRIHHIPKVLYHWRTVHGSAASSAEAKGYAYVAAKKALTDYMRRNKIEGEVMDGSWTGSYQMKRALGTTPLVSIIIVGTDRQRLDKCIAAIEQATTYSPYEILAIDMNNRDGRPNHREGNTQIISHPGIANVSAARNLAATHARGEYLLFLDENLEVLMNDWLDAMLQHAQRAEVGAVGAKLIDADHRLLHCGITLGLGKHRVAGYPLSGFPSDIPGYFGNVSIVRNCSAVTGACLMLRRELFERVFGFNEDLAVAFGDVDLCLKLRQEGYLIVYTPSAEFRYHGVLNPEYSGSMRVQYQLKKDASSIRQKWGPVIDAGDPYYNPNLTLEREDCSIRI